MEQTKFYTVDEAADRLQVHKNTVYRWIRFGLLKAHTIGLREFRIAETDLDAMYQPVQLQQPEQKTEA